MRKLLLYTGLVLVLGIQFYSCTSNELSGTGFSNEPPTVWLSSAPPEGSVAAYTITMFWGGWDPDGEISHFEYVITDNKSGVFDPADTVGAWETVFGNDSTFQFTADIFADSTNSNWRNDILTPFEFQRSHTFFVRAVDDHGARSRPVYRSFTSRTLSPTVIIDVPFLNSPTEQAQVPSVTTFQWTGKDFVSTTAQEQEPDSVRHILVGTAKFQQNFEFTEEYIRTHPDAEEWSDWEYYRAPGDTGKFWTTPPLDFGPYVFAVQVKDEAGAVSPVFDLNKNMRRVRVSTRSTGPVLTVTNEFVGVIQTTSPNAPVSIVDLPAGVPLRFCFRADASSYGGLVSGYRYGWDINDLNDDSEWETSLTPFVGSEACSSMRTFFFGVHNFYVEVVDNSGYPSRVAIRINIIPFTMQKPLLIVDDWIEGSPSSTGWTRSNGALPSDVEHDNFWKDMAADVDGFNPDIDMVGVGSGTGLTEVPIQIVANYQTMIWTTQGDQTAPAPGTGSILRDLIVWRDPEQPVQSGKIQPNIAALFMAAGGHMMIVGEKVMTGVIPRFPGSAIVVYPIIFRYELAGDQDGSYAGRNDVGKFGVGQDSFAYRDCCLNVLDIAYLSGNLQVRRPPNQQKPPGTGCPVDQMRDHAKTSPPNSTTDGITAVDVDPEADLPFPRLEIREEAAGEGRWYATAGLNSDVYNPEYFNDRTACGGSGGVAEMVPRRSCFQPIYRMECRNQSSVVYGATVAFWTSRYADRIPDVGGVAARSCVFGFHLVFMDPVEAKQAVDLVLFDEWHLQRK